MGSTRHVLESAHCPASPTGEHAIYRNDDHLLACRYEISSSPQQSKPNIACPHCGGPTEDIPGVKPWCPACERAIQEWEVAPAVEPEQPTCEHGQPSPAMCPVSGCGEPHKTTNTTHRDLAPSGFRHGSRDNRIWTEGAATERHRIRAAALALPVLHQPAERLVSLDDLLYAIGGDDA